MNGQNTKYIVNLAKQVVGEKIIEGLIKTKEEFTPETLTSLLRGQISKKLEKMTPETLGRIGAFGPSRLAQWWADDSGFIRRTSIWDAGFCKPSPQLNQEYGREVLENLALTTIIATVFDIVHQGEYQENAKYERGIDHDMDRAAYNILHGIPGAKF